MVFNVFEFRFVRLLFIVNLRSKTNTKTPDFFVLAKIFGWDGN